MIDNQRNWRKLTAITCVGLAAIAGAYYWYTQIRGRRVFLVNGSLAAAAAAASYPKLLKGEESKNENREYIVERSKADVLAIMDRVIETQVKLRHLIRQAIKEILDENLKGVKQIYEYVYNRKPKDPLEEHGLQMAEFDVLMNKWQDDPEVTQRTFTIVNGPISESENAEMFARAASLSVDKIVEIHQGVLERLKEGHDEIVSLQKTIEADDSIPYDSRTANLVLQVILGVYIEQTYQISAEGVEYAAMAKHNVLMGKPNYIAIHDSIQELLDQYSG